MLFYKSSRRTDPSAGNISCRNTAYDTVIYHEYGHFVDDKAGGIIDHGLSEGWGDVLATYSSEQPLVGEGLKSINNSPPKEIRTAENDYQYPEEGADSVKDPHVLGQAWSGFAWKLRKSLGKTPAENMVIPLLLANSRNIPDAVSDIILLDDDDANLKNGTPHFTQIFDAASAHNIPYFSSFVITINSPQEAAFISSSQGIVEITGTVDDALTPFSFEYYELSYAPGEFPDSEQWVPIGGRVTNKVINGKLGKWDIHNIPNGIYTIRVKAVLGGRSAEKWVRVLIQNIHEEEGVKVAGTLTLSQGQQEPAIFDDTVAWKEWSLSNPGDKDKIHLFNLRTLQERIITSQEQFLDYPALSKDQLVFKGIDSVTLANNIDWIDLTQVGENPVVLAGDVYNIGIGKLILLQYQNLKTRKQELRLGILADTGAAFKNNLYQLDSFVGMVSSDEQLHHQTNHMLDTVNAYILYKKEQHGH